MRAQTCIEVTRDMEIFLEHDIIRKRCSLLTGRNGRPVQRRPNNELLFGVL